VRRADLKFGLEVKCIRGDDRGEHGFIVSDPTLPGRCLSDGWVRVSRTKPKAPVPDYPNNSRYFTWYHASIIPYTDAVKEAERAERVAKMHREADIKAAWVEWDRNAQVIEDALLELGFEKDGPRIGDGRDYFIPSSDTRHRVDTRACAQGLPSQMPDSPFVEIRITAKLFYEKILPLLGRKS
jgi:hypothetical protein